MLCCVLFSIWLQNNRPGSTPSSFLKRNSVWIFKCIKEYIKKRIEVSLIINSKLAYELLNLLLVYFKLMLNLEVNLTMNVFSDICIFYNSIEIVTTKTSFRILRYWATQSTSRTGDVYHFISEGYHCQIRLFNSTQKASLHLISDTFLQRPDNLVKMKNCWEVWESSSDFWKERCWKLPWLS